jgi:hypothetical protein
MYKATIFAPPEGVDAWASIAEFLGVLKSIVLTSS